MTVTYPTLLLDYNGTCNQNRPYPTFPPTLSISIFSLHNVNIKIIQIGAVLDDPTRYRCHVGKLNLLTHTRIIYNLNIKSIYRASNYKSLSCSILVLSYVTG